MNKIGKAGAIIVMILFFITIIALVYKDDVTVSVVEKEPIELIEADILSLGNEIIINSISEAPSIVRWLDEDSLILSGNGYDYSFNIVEKELTENTRVEEEVVIALKKLDNGGLLDFVDGEFFYIDEAGRKYSITKSVEEFSQLRYVINQSGTKVAYYNPERERIVVYNYSKDKHKIINKPIDQILIDTFEDSVKFSPHGGYVMFGYEYDDVTKNTFSIYGTDSGSTYATEVMGFSPMWSPDKTLKVVYKYTVDLEQVADKDESDFAYIPSRMGVFDVRTKKIDYLGVNIEQLNPYGKLTWIDNHLSFLNVNYVDATPVINELVFYDFDKKTFVSRNLGMNFIISDIISIDFGVHGKDILVEVNDGSYRLIFMNEEGIKETIEISNSLDATKKYEICNEGILYRKDKQIVFNNFMSLNEVYRISGNIIKLEVNDSNNRVVIVEEVEGKIKIVITKF